MTYFVDHNSVDKAKGDLLLTAEASVADSSMPGKPYCVTITTPFHTLVIAAKDTEEQQSWKSAIEQSILQARNSIRGYITKKGGLVDRGKTRKFFILHESAITWHQDHEHTSAIQGMMKLTPETTVLFDDAQNRITLTDTVTNATLGLRFDQNNHEYSIWKDGIAAILNKFAAVEKATVERIENAYENATKRGKLRMRPPKGGDIWDEYYFVLTPTELLVMEKNNDGQMEVIDLYEIHPNCSVFETNLGHYAFELVTSKKVLHVMSDSRESTAAWIHAIRTSIANSQPEVDDPLLQAALVKMEEDVFYDVSFFEDKPLGVVLERSGEWAIVKLSNSRDTGVSVGSALTSINGESCVLKTYAQTIERLKNWRPPLHLGFRRAPKKTGYLVKLSRQRRGNTQKNWQRRYFSLGDGRLMYKETETSSEVKGDVPLMGSAVSLLSSSETGKFFCFRLVSGVTSLTMQGETMDEMMDWASTLFHAIAIANGGSHILSIERKRVEEEQARQRAREEAIAAKQRAEAEALRIKQEAEARLRAEEEARRKAIEEENKRRAALAEEERLKLEAADRKQREIESIITTLSNAISSLNLTELNNAISVAEASPHQSEINLINEAKALHNDLIAKETAALKAKADAESELNNQLHIASIDTLEALAKAISKAEEVNADQTLVNNSRDKLIVLRREKSLIDEVKNSLESAIEFQSINGLIEALMSAATINLQDPIVNRAQDLLSQLQIAEKKRQDEENARLAAEAAALDAEMAAEAAAVSKLAEHIRVAQEEEILDVIGERESMHVAVEDSDEEPGDEADSEEESEGEEEDTSAFPLPDTNKLRAYAASLAAGSNPTPPSQQQQQQQSGSLTPPRNVSPPPAPRNLSPVPSSLPRNQSPPPAPVNAGERKSASPPPINSSVSAVRLASLSPKAYNAPQVEHVDPRSSLSPAGGPPLRTGRPRVSTRRRPLSFRSQGRKLATRRERLEAERKAAENRIQPTIVTAADMISVFTAYSRLNEKGVRVMIPLHFSIVWRLVSQDKGNLFKEMQMFQRFDSQNEGYLTESDFIRGWQEFASQPGGAIILDRMKDLTGDDKVLL
eukprot:CAMPEP_0174818500 /NCGR_PEP_ID=MMETSP1107-20130205/1172_1 /TAXON_ID=36770 /ORGANISM="Paraphysomonas vestita, Strain GFlagA" /LENGTH=1084 /DNA_ID=CAMNT_0016030393 /DNA_START=1357 /DNA_END=4611 /DNA_ORIENTATION=-